MCNVLMLEDSPTDAELVERKLREAGIVFTGRLVSSKAGFLDAVTDRKNPPDVILADYTLPSFLGTEALALAQEHCPGTPFIFVTGTMGEETAVEALKSGATDYVLKDRLFRLPEVVERALEGAKARKQLKEAEERRRATEHELIVANRAKDDFLAFLSHELRNPLMPLLVNAELIVKEAVNPVNRERAEAIRRQAYHMSKLLDDLLDVTRITQGKITLKKSSVELREIVEQAIEMVRPLALERGHTITADVEPLRVDADPIRLEQIVVNLLNNAAKYTDRGGRIGIGARAEGGEAVIVVKDTGIGVSPELLPHIFDLFISGDHSSARIPNGLGVGLTLVRRLVELHGGSVEAKSAGEGKGSEFTVRLPLGTADADQDMRGDQISPKSATSARGDSPRKTVLVVDDNRDLADALGAALRALGHTVRLAYDGTEALRAAGEASPEVIMLDIGMPVPDGFAVARVLREKFGHSMELIAISGYGQEQDKRRAYEAGFDRYVVKPIGIQELRELFSTSPSNAV